MKAWNCMSVLAAGGLILGGLLAGACAGDDATTTGAGGGGGSDSTSSTMTTTTTGMTTSSTMTGAGPTTTTGGGGAPPGMGICESELTIDGAVYDGCLSANCCDSFDPCLADADCATCLESGPMGAGCDTNALYQAFQGCFDTSCTGAICDTELATGSPNLNACIDANCCTTFNACEVDAACAACLGDPMGAGCDMLPLFTDYTTCRDMSCPADICGTQIVFGITYGNGSQDIAYDSNLCAATNCCADLTACADPAGDGFLEMDDPEVAACVLCLQGDAACAAGPVKTSADAFNACFMTSCGN